jgi:hypothetical protein
MGLGQLLDGDAVLGGQPVAEFDRDGDGLFGTQERRCPTRNILIVGQSADLRTLN